MLTLYYCLCSNNRCKSQVAPGTWIRDVPPVELEPVQAELAHECDGTGQGDARGVPAARVLEPDADQGAHLPATSSTASRAACTAGAGAGGAGAGRRVRQGAGAVGEPADHAVVHGERAEPSTPRGRTARCTTSTAASAWRPWRTWTP